MKVTFIGAGKVGFTLGRFLKSDRVIIAGYYSRHADSAAQAAQFTGSKAFETLEELISESDAIFLTVPDSEIKKTYLQLCEYDISDKIICHCSGALSCAEAFEDISKHNAKGISIHPLFPVSDKLTCYRKLTDAFFCLEGQEEAVAFWRDYLESLGVHTRIIDGNHKTKYHAACAIASNLVCALMKDSVELLTECGFDSKEALMALNPLVKANIEAILSRGVEEALTGPVERGDTETVMKHLRALETPQKTENMRMERYRLLSIKLLQIANSKHPDRDYSQLTQILENI